MTGASVALPGGQPTAAHPARSGERTCVLACRVNLRVTSPGRQADCCVEPDQPRSGADKSEKRPKLGSAGKDVPLAASAASMSSGLAAGFRQS